MILKKDNVISKWLLKYYLQIFLVVFLLFPLIISRDQYYVRMFTVIILFAYWGLCWNLIGGFTGQFSLGHATFIGLGAYTSTILYTNFNISPWIGMLAGGIIAAFIGLIIGFACFRLKGPYFTLSTLALAWVFMDVFSKMDTLWGIKIKGMRGLYIREIGSSSLWNLQFRDNTYYYYIILGMSLLLLFLSHKILRSRSGFYMQAISQDQEAAESLGVNSLKYKLFAMAISAFFTALGGTFLAQLQLCINPHQFFGIDMSIEMVLITIIGGGGTLFGPILGAFLLRPIGELARTYLSSSLLGAHLILYGAAIVLVVIFIPNGIISLFKKKDN